MWSTCLVNIIRSIVSRLHQNSFEEKTITVIADQYLKYLQEIVDHCCAKQSVEFTPSDFDTVDLSQEELDKLLS